MKLRSSTIVAALALCCAGPLAAQLGLVRGLPALPRIDDLTKPVDGLLGKPLAEAGNTLRRARLDRIETLLRANRQTLERDRDGAPARRGVLLLIDPDPAMLVVVNSLGFRAAALQHIENLDLAVSQVTIPDRVSLAQAQKLITKKLPRAIVSSDQIFFQSGGAGASGSVAALVDSGPVKTAIGLIDGAPAQWVTGIKGFASGAPFASNHGSAVAALAYAAGGHNIYVADVYGTDPAGGNALAIAQGMGWLLGRGAKVISLSLSGPRSPLLERAVASAQARGAVIVAAVGNDGPAAPPSFPASYNGVLAITGVDKRDRPLIEAGRAAHLDYAAPGADISALDRTGKLVPVRGTSFAAPLVAVRAAAALERGATPRGVIAALDAEAVQISRRRPDPQSGRGLLCSACR